MHLASNVVVICTFIDLWALPQVTSKVCRALFISFSFSLSQRARTSLVGGRPTLVNALATAGALNVKWSQPTHSGLLCY